MESKHKHRVKYLNKRMAHAHRAHAQIEIFVQTTAKFISEIVDSPARVLLNECNKSKCIAFAI